MDCRTFMNLHIMATSKLFIWIHIQKIIMQKLNRSINMDIFDMSEAAYLNGYKKGYADAVLGKMPVVDIEEDYFEEDEPPCTRIPS